MRMPIASRRSICGNSFKKTASCEVFKTRLQNDVQISIRPMRKGDGVGILTLQRRAIHEVGRASYPAEILHVWCPPIAPANLPAAGARFEARITPEESILVAEVDRRLAGFGVV